MRAHEFIKEDASASSSCAGSMAVAVQPMGTISRSSASLQNGKYFNDPVKDSQLRKYRASRQFKNSISN
jgi:hypothetical protein